MMASLTSFSLKRPPAFSPSKPPPDIQSITKPVKKLCLDSKKAQFPGAFISPPVSEEDVTSKTKTTKIEKQHEATLCSVFPLYFVQELSVEQDCLKLKLSPSLSDPQSAWKTCLLKHFWKETFLSVGDKVMLHGEFEASGTCIVDNENNLIITHPEILVSPTIIGGASFCMRKSLLQDMIRSETTMEMFVGTLVHDLMQRIAAAAVNQSSKTKNPKSKGSFFDSAAILDALLRDPRYRQDMYSLNVSEFEIREIAASFIPAIEKWANSELISNPSNEIADIEEWIWSPRFGVKGRVDMTLRTNKAIRPLEIKTGKASFGVSHTGQVLLYTLLLSEKYKTSIKEGILFYAKTGEWKTVTAKQSDLGALIRIRNEFSHYLKKAHNVDDGVYQNLPRPLNNDRLCSKCQMNTSCSLLYKRIEEPNGIRKLPERHFMNDLVSRKVSHLKEEHLEYFTKWVKAIYMESFHSQSSVSVLDLWEEKEKSKDFCLSSLRMTDISSGTNQNLTYNLKGELESGDCKLNPGDLVILREDCDGGTVIDLCTINSIEKSPVVSVSLQADRFFRNGALKDKLLRIDKYVFSASSMAASYDGLSRLMESDDVASRLRSLLIDRMEPKNNTAVDKDCLVAARPLMKSLEGKQREAAMKMLFAKDYFVMETVIDEVAMKLAASLLRILHVCRKTVLLISSSGSTLDGVLKHLVAETDQKISLLRLGPVARVAAELHHICAETIASDADYETMRSKFRTAEIVASTNGNHRQPALTGRRFDVCFVLEATLMLQPSLIGFLMLAESFVFMGDGTKSFRARNPAVAETMKETVFDVLKEPAKKSGAWVSLV